MGANEWGVQAEMTIRPAREEDAPAVAAILATAFPALYASTFGRLDTAATTALLTNLYTEGLLSLETTKVAVREGKVVGVAILHVGKDIGRGTARLFWRTLRRQLDVARATRAFAGGLTTNAFLNQRIPRAFDLVYVEALAVAEPERGSGIGSGLLDHITAWARITGRRRVALHVLQKNEGARRLYARQGFVIWPGTERAARSGRRVSEWVSLLLVRPLE